MLLNILDNLMKYIVLSFDDSREDFYTRAYPLLLKYGLKATLNVTSGFIINPQRFNFPSGDSMPMTPNQILEVQKSGIEIGCHGSMHLNTAVDLRQNIRELNDFGINTQSIGFASPGSHLTDKNKNDHGIWNMLINGEISYIRTGIQIRREGYFYSLFSLIDRFVQLPSLYKVLNKKNIIKSKGNFFPSVTVFSYTTNSQIQYLIKSMPEESSIILMFHSILLKTDAGYGKDKFYWDKSDFEKLLKFLRSNKNITICTNKELLSIY